MHIKLLISLSYFFFAAPDENIEFNVDVSSVFGPDVVLIGFKRDSVKDTKPEKTDGEKDESEAVLPL